LEPEVRQFLRERKKRERKRKRKEEVVAEGRRFRYGGL
jgi:hypothetical protein